MRGHRVVHVAQLDLRGHDGFVPFGGKTTTFAHHARRIRGRRDDRGLLDGHGDQSIHTIDEEVQPQPERQGVDADGVLDHAVRAHGRDAARDEQGEVFGRKAGLSGELGLALFER